MMQKLTPRCNFCLLIIHTFLEGTQPAGGMQAAVGSGGGCLADRLSGLQACGRDLGPCRSTIPSTELTPSNSFSSA